MGFLELVDRAEGFWRYSTLDPAAIAAARARERKRKAAAANRAAKRRARIAEIERTEIGTFDRYVRGVTGESVLRSRELELRRARRDRKADVRAAILNDYGDELQDRYNDLRRARRIPWWQTARLEDLRRELWNDLYGEVRHDYLAEYELNDYLSGEFESVDDYLGPLPDSFNDDLQQRET